MTDNTTKDSDILKYAIVNGIIDFGSIRAQYEECERMNLLDSYEYKIFESGGRWYCRLPDGRRIKRKNREDVEKEILKILKEIKKAEMDSGGKIPEEVFTEWNESRLNSGVIEGSTALRYRKTYDKYIKNADINKKPMKRITQKEWICFLQDIYNSGSPDLSERSGTYQMRSEGNLKSC